MPLHLPTLLYTCIGALVLSAGLITAFSSKLKTYRGFWYWITAQWLLALGLLLLSLEQAVPALLPIAILLLLQCPILILVGLRRFFSRHALRVPVFADGLALALAGMVWLVAWIGFRASNHWIAVFTFGSLALHFYAAALISRLQEFRGSVALQALAVVEVMVASLQLLQLGYWVISSGGAGTPHEFLLASGLPVVVPALMMVYLGPLMSWERTELALRAKQRKLRFLADMDALTNIPNRRRFLELSDVTLAASRPGATTVMMFDIDHFKQINDLHGHARGDEALRVLAHCVRRTMRAQDVAGRLGGDEFAMLLPDTDAGDGFALAGRIVALLTERHTELLAPRVSLSFGIVQMNVDEGLGHALRRADQALYEAKRQGRSRAVVATGVEEEPVFAESRPLGLGELSPSTPWAATRPLSV